MRIERTRVDGVFVIEPEPKADRRGLFARTFDAGTFRAAGLPTDWPQCNTSFNLERGTLRGLHYQANPKPDPKLVRCTRGRVFDVAVDIRPGSPTCRSWVGIELSADNRRAIYVAAGLAHGFITLEDRSEVYYQMGEVHDASLSRGVRWNDPAFGIAWPLMPSVISDRDAAYPDFDVVRVSFGDG